MRETKKRQRNINFDSVKHLGVECRKKMLSSVDKKLKSSVLIVKHKTDSKQICTSLFFCVFEHINKKNFYIYIAKVLQNFIYIKWQQKGES